MMSTKNKRGYWLALLVIIPAALQAQVTQLSDSSKPVVHQLSIQQAIDYAKKNNVQVKNALLDVKNQEQVNREVTGRAYPQVSASGSLVYNAQLPTSLVPAEFIGGPPGTFAPLVFGVKWGATGGVSFNQILFDGQVFTGLQARKTLIDYAEKNVEITDEMVRANIYKIYYQLVISKTQIELIEANIERLDKLAYDSKVMYDNGFVEKLTLDRLSVQQANLRTERTNALNQVQNGYIGLKVLMGMPVKDSLVLTDTLNDQDIKEGILAASDFTYSQRRDFQAADLGVKLREYDIQRYKRSKIPTLSLSGYYNKNAQRNEFDFFKSGPGREWFNISAFTLDLKIPIFSGFSTNARIAQARIALQQTQNLREQMKIDIDNDIAVAKNNFNSAIASLDNQKRNMELAESVYQQTKKKYESGLGDQSDIDNAQLDLRTAQNNYITSLYNAIIARIDFLQATGKL